MTNWNDLTQELIETEEELAASQGRGRSGQPSQEPVSGHDESRDPHAHEWHHGMSELTLKTPLNPQQRAYLNTVHQSADALMRLLNDILDVSKIEAGKMELEHAPFDLHEVVIDAVRVLGASATRKGVELVCRIAPDVPRSSGRRCRPRAPDYRQPGRQRPEIHRLRGSLRQCLRRASVERLDRIHFMIRDTGIGIPQEKQQGFSSPLPKPTPRQRVGSEEPGWDSPSPLNWWNSWEAACGSRAKLGTGSTFHFTARFDLANDGAIFREATPRAAT